MTNKTIDAANNTISNISNSSISATAAIADSKLATISTAGKVSGAAITSGTIAGTTAVSTSGDIATTGKVGIGAAAGTSKLEITGNGATSATSALNVMNSTPTSLLYVRNDGNVGIGTTTPASKLDVAGAITASGDIKIPFTSGNTKRIGFYADGAYDIGLVTNWSNNLRVDIKGQEVIKFYPSYVSPAPVHAPMGFAVTAESATRVPIKAILHASQTADAFQVLASDGTTKRMFVDANGAVTTTANGAASTPAELLTGTWFTGGTATTTKPQLLIEPTGTTSTNWSTSGTGIGVNASSSFVGNLIDYQKNGVNRFRVDSAGDIYGGNGNYQIVNGYITGGRFVGSSGTFTLYDGGGFPAVALGSNTNIYWETGTTVAGSRNVGLVKSASGQIGVNDGTNGSTNWRDLILRNLTASGNITASGNVGIGTTSPGAKLDVASASGGASSGLRLIQSAENASAPSSYVPIDFSVPTTGLIGQFFATANNYSNASANLPANSIGLWAESTSGTLSFGASGASGDIRFNTGGFAIANERMRISSAGNVGIGTTSPAYQLDVKSPSGVSASPFRVIAGLYDRTAITVDVNGIPHFPFGADVDGGTLALNSSLGSFLNSTNLTFVNAQIQDASGNFRFGNRGLSSEYLRITSGGKVGIGTTSPQAKLHVDGGAICVSAGAGSDDCSSAANTAGTIFAVNTTVQGADYAEYFATEDELTPGDIVGINLRSGLVRRYHAGDNLVGVVSTQPGVIGNSKIKDKNSVLVALMGQVPFNRQATSTHGNIVKTPDGVQIGYILASGDLYLQMSSTEKKISELRLEKDREIAKLKAEMESEVAQLKATMKTVLCDMKPEAAFCAE